MKLNKKSILISLGVIILLVGGYFLFSVYLNNNELVVSSDNNDNEIFAVFLETGYDTNVYNYSEVTEWPADYIFNSEKSYCTYGSELSWDGTGVAVSLSGSDICYVYFKVPPDIYLASMTLNGSATSSIPTKTDTMFVGVSCANATGKWNYEDWYLEVDNVTDKVNCSVDFTNVTNPPTVAQHIIDLHSGTDGTEGIYYTNSSEYRYTGMAPNNYIWFNDELWRIIGVFDGDSHGRDGENLVKIISEDTYSYAFDTANDNSWADSGGGATLNTLYNTYYYNSTNGTSYAGCRGHSSSLTKSCDFTNSGLDAEAREMVQSVTWYLGGHSISGVTASVMYGYERGSTVSSGTYTSTTANIGLMYASDYGYAAPPSCLTTNLSSYNTAACGGNNWLLENQYEFTLTATSTTSNFVWSVGYHGGVTNINVYIGYASRPVLYLKSSLVYLGGTGSEADPFIVG